MTAKTVQPISTEAIKEAIVALIKENDADFKQLLRDLLPQISTPNTHNAPKKIKKKQEEDKPTEPKARIPYSEMPFWKANPHLKPLDPKPYAIQKENFEALQSLFQESDCPTIEEWIAELD